MELSNPYTGLLSHKSSSYFSDTDTKHDKRPVIAIEFRNSVAEHETDDQAKILYRPKCPSLGAKGSGMVEKTV
jgi:hypothetical protein